MDALVRWLDYAYVERKAYSEILDAMIPAAGISSEFSEFLLKKYKLNRLIPERQDAAFFEEFIENYRECSDSDLLPISFADYQFSKNNEAIHLYLREKVFSINEYQPDGFITRIEYPD